MADFDPPWSGIGGERRAPVTDETENGFPCGPADRALFNFLFHRVESEIGEVITFAGLTPTDDRYTQLREAIEALIAAATGGGDTSQFLLVSQARARLPIFPEVVSADAKIGVYAPTGGTVRVPAGVTFMHRGIYPITTDETDFATAASKTYHLRWNPDDGFNLQDLADLAYNPDVLAETDDGFDSTYDDMLVSRIVTNSSNVATITNLVNKVRLHHQVSVDAGLDNAVTTPGTLVSTAVTLDWARTPIVFDPKLYGVGCGVGSFPGGYVSGYGYFGMMTLVRQDPSRYGTSDMQYYYDDSAHNQGRVAYIQDFRAE